MRGFGAANKGAERALLEPLVAVGCLTRATQQCTVPALPLAGTWSAAQGLEF